MFCFNGHICYFLLTCQLNIKISYSICGRPWQRNDGAVQLQGAQNNSHPYKQTLNGIISFPSSSWFLHLILFLMVLCGFTESHLKYFSEVVGVWTKSWKKKSNPMPVKRTETEVYTECLQSAKLSWQAGGYLVFGKKATQCAVLCYYIKPAYQGDTLSQLRDDQAGARGNDPSLLPPRWFAVPPQPPWTPT